MNAKVKETLDATLDRIKAALVKGVAPWRKTWTATGGPMNFASKRRYTGPFNIMVLMMSGFASPYWLTFNQAKKLGGYPRKDEHGTPIFLWKFFEVTEDDGDKKRIPWLKFFKVFNAEQIDGIDFPEPEGVKAFDSIEACEAFVANVPKDMPSVSHGGDRASYSPGRDAINMPNKEAFDVPEAYYSTLYHEMAHATGAEKRLSRPGITDFSGFGSHEYGREELVAEMSAVSIASMTGIDEVTFNNSSAYLAHWLKAINEDPGMLMWASGRAAKAVAYLVNAPKEEEAEA